MSDEFAARLIELVPRLRRYALVACKSEALADDLVQIACEKAWTSRRRFRHGTRFEPWVFRILRNTWIDHARSARRTGDPVDIDSMRDHLAGAGAEQNDTRAELNDTLRAIRELPDAQREVLVLVCLNEMSYREVSEILDVPIGTVMSRLSRGREKLMARLGINADGSRHSDRQAV